MPCPGTSNPLGLRDNYDGAPGGHIRVAIPTMCVGMLVVAVLMIVLMSRGCVPNGKGEDGSVAAAVAAEDEEKQSLVMGDSATDE